MPISTRQCQKFMRLQKAHIVPIQSKNYLGIDSELSFLNHSKKEINKIRKMHSISALTRAEVKHLLNSSKANTLSDVRYIKNLLATLNTKLNIALPALSKQEKLNIKNELNQLKKLVM